MAPSWRIQRPLWVFSCCFLALIFASTGQETNNRAQPIGRFERLEASRSSNGSTVEQGILTRETDEDAEDAIRFGLLPRNESSYIRATVRNVTTTTTPAPPFGDIRRMYPMCPVECDMEWLGNEWCDTECNVEECAYDYGDCEGWCAGECRPGWPGDGECDIGCYKEECSLDGGDCKALEERNLTSIDFSDENFDYSNCTCAMGIVGDGSCDPECNTYECLFDGGDCQFDCDKECPAAWLGDGACDRECDSKQCFFDKGDCRHCAEGCRTWKLGNTICDRDCMNEECEFDQLDCDGVLDVLELNYDLDNFSYIFCAEQFLGDGSCDIACNQEKFNWDGGDCLPGDTESATQPRNNTNRTVATETTQ